MGLGRILCHHPQDEGLRARRSGNIIIVYAAIVVEVVLKAIVLIDGLVDTLPSFSG